MTDLKLTPQETKVAELILLAFSDKEIARKMERSISAVKQHAKSIYKKASVANRTQFVAKHHLGAEKFNELREAA